MLSTWSAPVALDVRTTGRTRFGLAAPGESAFSRDRLALERCRRAPHSVAELLGEVLVFTTPTGNAVICNRYDNDPWKPSLIAAGVDPTSGHGMHVLRHHYASVLLDAGVSIRALADYLGHTDPGFTLRLYSHLMPHTEDRARAAPAESRLNGQVDE